MPMDSKYLETFFVIRIQGSWKKTFRIKKKYLSYNELRGQASLQPYCPLNSWARWTRVGTALLWLS